MTNTNIRVVDLFAGGGGLSLGFMNAGYNVVAAFDNWDPAIALYKANFSSHPIIKCDLSNEQLAAKAIAQYNPDLIVGGPPCQDFSSAGKRNEKLGRADLTVSFANIIATVRPHFFVMENVDRAVKSNAFARAKKILKKAGYGLSLNVLDACRCGVPQTRKRLFLIGELNGQDDLMSASIHKDLSKEAMTVRKYFKSSLNIEYYYRHPRSYARRAIFSVDEPSPTIRGVNRPIAKGYKGHKGDVAPITSDVRPLSTKERSMIQTFPESFILAGNKTDVEQIIGNAVPVKLAEYVALRLKKHIAMPKNENVINPTVYILSEKASRVSSTREKNRACHYA